MEGKTNVLGAIDILDGDGFAGAFGLVDADFDHIEMRTAGGPRLARTELHDLDATLLRSTSFESLLVEFGSAKKIADYGDLRGLLLAAAEPIGQLRLHSERTGLNLRFKGMNYGSCLRKKEIATDPEAMVREVLRRSQRQDRDIRDLTEGISSIASEGHDPWWMCCSDDLLGILSACLRSMIGNNNATEVSDAQLRRALRLGYTQAEFEASALARAIRRWEETHAPFRLLRRR